MSAPSEHPAAGTERVTSFQIGLSAERRACLYLIAKGYRILARRYRTPHGEIDVVAKRRATLVFAEVKARNTLEDAAYSVTPRQQQRIATAASLWLAAHPDHANLDCRFDVILIAPRRLPRHLEAAFETSSF
jgi:putative endonuclease